MKRANTWIAALFLLFLLGMLALMALGARTTASALLSDWNSREDTAASSLLDKAEFVTEHGESALNKGLDRSHAFIQLYGAVQRLLGQRLVEDSTPDTSVTKLENGALTFCGLGNAYIDPTENAEKTAVFVEELTQMGFPFLAVVAPEKIQYGTKPLPEAVPEFGNEIADAYLEVLAEAGVDAFDLRPAFNAREDYYDLFFRTDHHWKPEGAFFACGVLMEELSERYGFPVNEEALDEENWDKTVYKDWFLGSQGKRVGSFYAGVDDFTVYTPQFDTAFRYTIPERDAERAGTFSEALCYEEYVTERNWFNGNPYVYYSGGDWAEATMVNEANPDGPKVVLIRDSFSCALAPFLALQCSELTTIDLRYYQGDLKEGIAEIDPDLVMLLYSASTTRLESLFQFEK